MSAQLQHELDSEKAYSAKLRNEVLKLREGLREALDGWDTCMGYHGWSYSEQKKRFFRVSKLLLPEAPVEAEK